MTIEELNYIKDAFSQIIDDIAGNPDWYEAARAVASDLGTLERELGKKVASPPSNLDEAAQKIEDYYDVGEEHGYLYCHRGDIKDAFKAGAEWREAQILKLPDNLDDAAWNYVAKKYGIKESEKIFENEEIAEDFKAGAEWMAGQGESHETEIVSRVTGNGLLPAVTCLVNKSYKEGDKVVVQIRKK